jgi:hypothetical protein
MVWNFMWWIVVLSCEKHSIFEQISTMKWSEPSLPIGDNGVEFYVVESCSIVLKACYF